MRKIVPVLFFVVGLTISASASARNWARVNEAIWIDRDSIRRSGDIVSFDGTNRDPASSPDDAHARAQHLAYNCATNYLGAIREGRGFVALLPMPPQQAALYAAILCR